MCDEYCMNKGCNQGRSCPARAQHYKPEKLQSTVEFISKVAIAAALIAAWGYLLAECMV